MHQGGQSSKPSPIVKIGVHVPPSSATPTSVPTRGHANDPYVLSYHFAAHRSLLQGVQG